MLKAQQFKVYRAAQDMGWIGYANKPVDIFVCVKNYSYVLPGVGVTMTSHNPKCSVSTILSSL